MCHCNVRENSPTNVQLHDLDTMNLLCIFDFLDMQELLSMVEVNNRFHQVIGHHYIISKYHVNEKLIRIAHSENHLDANQITFSKYETITRLLKFYGHLITKLEVSGTFFNIKQIEEIVRYIERYCCESLIELRLLYAGEYLLNAASRTFDKVTSLVLKSYDDYLKKPDLLRIYPILERLTLAVGKSFKLPIIEEHLPSLKNLEFFELNRFVNDSYLESFLRLNLHLNSLSLNRVPTLNLSRFLVQNLPKLHKLGINYDYNPLVITDWHSDHNETVHFKTIKQLNVKIENNHFFNRFPITFEYLETLDIVLTSYHNVPLDLIEQNDKLAVLSIPLRFVQNFQQILDAIRNLRRLEELTTNWDDTIRADLIQLMTDNTNLQKITFFVLKGERDPLLATIPDEWQFMKEWKDKLMYTFLTFERANIA